MYIVNRNKCVDKQFSLPQYADDVSINSSFETLKEFSLVLENKLFQN